MTAPAIPSSRSAETDGVVRPLAAADLPEFRRLLDADPVAHCFVSARLAEVSDSGHRMAADFWVVERGGRCVAALHVGANVVPIATDDGARRVLAERLRRTGRRGSSLVGPSDEVLDLWDRLDGAWGPARDVRARQPLLVMDRPSAIAADPHAHPTACAQPGTPRGSHARSRGAGSGDPAGRTKAKGSTTAPTTNRSSTYRGSIASTIPKTLMRPNTKRSTVTAANIAMMNHAFHADRQRITEITTRAMIPCMMRRKSHQAELDPGTSASVKPVHGAPT